MRVTRMRGSRYGISVSARPRQGVWPWPRPSCCHCIGAPPALQLVRRVWSSDQTAQRQRHRKQQQQRVGSAPLVSVERGARSPLSLSLIPTRSALRSAWTSGQNPSPLRVRLSSGSALVFRQGRGFVTGAPPAFSHSEPLGVGAPSTARARWARTAARALDTLIRRPLQDT